MTAILMAGQMHPPFLFWPCQKRNGPCTVQREKTLRRVGLRQRRPPAAGGGWLAVPRSSQRRKRASLGETSSPGRSGIHPASLFAAAGRLLMKALARGKATASASAGQRVAKRNARKEELVKCVLAPRLKMHRAAGTNDQACTVPRRARRPVLANTQTPSHADPRTATLHVCAKLRPKAVFSFGPCTARFLFHKMEKMGGVYCPAINIADPASNGTHPNTPLPRRRISRL